MATAASGDEQDDDRERIRTGLPVYRIVPFSDREWERRNSVLVVVFLSILLACGTNQKMDGIGFPACLPDRCLPHAAVFFYSPMY